VTTQVAKTRLLARLARDEARKPITIFVGMCLSMLVGIAFQSFLASHLGTGVAVDVFYLGTTIPTLIATIMLGSAANALMRSAIETPVLARFHIRPNSVPFRLTIISLLFSAGMAVTGLAMLINGLPLFHGSVRSGVGELLLITTPVPPLAVIAAMGSVRALVDQRFVIGTYGGAVNGIGLLATTVALSHGGLGAAKLGVAVDGGYFLQVVFVWSALRRTPNKIRAVSLPPETSKVLARRATALFLLLAGASAIYKSQPLVERLVGEALGSGVPAALGYAEKITTGLTQLAVFGFSIALLPSLSRDLYDQQSRRAISRLQFALAATFASAAAVVAFGLVSSGDLVRVFYERGAFGTRSSSITNLLVLGALPSVAFGALAGPLVSLWYAAGRIRAVAGIGLCGFGAGTGATIILPLLLGYQGIVLGTAVGYTLTFAIFAKRARTVLTDWSWSRFFARFGFAMGVTGVAVTAMSIASRALLTATSASAVLDLTCLAARFTAVLLVSFGTLALVTKRRTLSTLAVER
jgi:putative peptidoglycan lipid II flippase